YFRNIRSHNLHVNVIHANWTRQRWIAKHLDADSVWSFHESLVRIRRADRVCDVSRLPSSARGIDVLQNKSEMINHRTSWRGGRLSFLQQDEYAWKLNHRKRTVVDESASHHDGPEPPLGVNVFHRQMDVTQPDAEVIWWLAKLRERER